MQSTAKSRARPWWFGPTAVLAGLLASQFCGCAPAGTDQEVAADAAIAVSPDGDAAAGTDGEDGAVADADDGTDIAAGLDSEDEVDGATLEVAPQCTKATDCPSTNPCLAPSCSSAGTCTAFPKADGDPCDDGDPCTQGDGCQAGQCAAGANLCTCKTTADCAKQEDGNLCNGTLYCDKASGAPYTCKVNPATVIACPSVNDSACQKNTCVAATGACAVMLAPDNTSCSDENPCTTGDFCKGGVCNSGAKTCDCTVDADCKSQEDGDLCNGTLYCNKATQKCALNPSTVVKCQTVDDTPCQQSLCSPKVGQCSLVTVPDGKACDDGNPCTPNEGCLAGQCASAVNTCECQKDADCLAKDDGNLCNGTLYCSLKTKKCHTNPVTVVACNSDDDPPCLADVCDPKTGKCQEIGLPKAGSPCDDGNPCTALSVCAAGNCQGQANLCECQVDADCAAKEDGDSCNGTLFCNPKVNKCEINPATVVSCPSAFDQPCMANQCDPKTGSCAMKPAHQGNPCKNPGGEAGGACSGGGWCQAGLCEVTTLQVCECTKDADCAKNEDGNLCNGTLYCDKTATKPTCKLNAATIMTCKTASDSACSKAACQPTTGQCLMVDQYGPCEDGLACTEKDACFQGNCVALPVACQDGLPCTADGCTEPFGCLYLAASNTPCDDGNSCTAGDSCQAGVCTPGAAKPCDDGNACTTESCDKAQGCVTLPNSLTCTDGNACTVGDGCAAGKCVAGAPKTCPGAVCQVASCSAPLGVCALSNGPDGSPCDDGDSCSEGDTCTSGVCIGKSAFPQPITGKTADKDRLVNGRMLADGGQVLTGRQTSGAKIVPRLVVLGADGKIKVDTLLAEGGEGRDVVAREIGGYFMVGGRGYPVPYQTFAATFFADGTLIDEPSVGNADSYLNAVFADGKQFRALGRRKMPGSVGFDLWMPRLFENGACFAQGCDPSVDLQGGDDLASDGLLLPDGGLIAAGESATANGTLSGALVRFDATGSKVWAKFYGTGAAFYAIEPVPGGYVLAGTKGGKAWLVKTDTAGNQVYDKSFAVGGALRGFVVGADSLTGAGTTSSGTQAWVAGFGLGGDLLWQRTDMLGSHEGLVPRKNGLLTIGNTSGSGAHLRFLDPWGFESCLAAGTCGATSTCSDGNPCTADWCDKDKGCQHTGQGDVGCNDGNACTLSDPCVGGVCEPGAVTQCNDDNTCTADTCSATKGCENKVIADATPCKNGAEAYCNQGVCVEVKCPPGYATVQVDVGGGIFKANCAAIGPVWGQRPLKPTGVYSSVAGGIAVLDSQTQLMWQAATANSAATHAEALSYCESLSLAGHTDWRLPWPHELASLLDYSIAPGNKTIDTKHFPDTAVAYYWSAEASLGTATHWYVQLGSGDLNAGTGKHAFRCLRTQATLAVAKSRFELSQGGAIATDTWTELEWTRSLSTPPMVWADAQTHCSNLQLEGKAGWRLPTIRELQSLVYHGQGAPVLDLTAFPKMPMDSWLWSATTHAGDSGFAWRMHTAGDVYNGCPKAACPHPVLCVR